MTNSQKSSLQKWQKWSEVKVAQSCPTLCGPMDYTVHGILQARILEWVAFPFSRGSPQPRDWTQVSHIVGGFFTSWAAREANDRDIAYTFSAWIVTLFPEQQGRSREQLLVFQVHAPRRTCPGCCACLAPGDLSTLPAPQWLLWGLRGL